MRLAYQLLKTSYLLWLIAMSGQSSSVDTDNDGIDDIDDEINVTISFANSQFMIEVQAIQSESNPIQRLDFRFGREGSSCFIEVEGQKQEQSTSSIYVAKQLWTPSSGFKSGNYGVIDGTPRIFLSDNSVKYDQQQYFLAVNNINESELQIDIDAIVISKVPEIEGRLRVDTTISGVSADGLLSKYPSSSDSRYDFKMHLKNGESYVGGDARPSDVIKVTQNIFKVTTFHDLKNTEDFNDPKVERIKVCDAAMRGRTWNLDSDGDGMVDVVDDFSLDATETIDTDSDGIGNNADTDDDGDGLSDSQEATYGTNPLVGDTDGDDYSDSEETDYDTDPLDADSYPIIRGLNWGLIKTVLDQQNQSAD